MKKLTKTTCVNALVSSNRDGYDVVIGYQIFDVPLDYQQDNELPYHLGIYPWRNSENNKLDEVTYTVEYLADEEFRCLTHRDVERFNYLSYDEVLKPTIGFK